MRRVVKVRWWTYIGSTKSWKVSWAPSRWSVRSAELLCSRPLLMISVRRIVQVNWNRGCTHTQYHLPSILALAITTSRDLCTDNPKLVANSKSSFSTVVSPWRPWACHCHELVKVAVEVLQVACGGFPSHTRHYYIPNKQVLLLQLPTLDIVA